MSRRRSLLRGSRGGGFDPDYQAVLDEADLQGYTKPSSSQQTLQNQLVLDLKSAGVWSKLDLFYLYVNDAGVDFSYINWLAPTKHYLTTGWGVTWQSNYGFTQVRQHSPSYDFATDTINFSQNDASFGFKLGSGAISGSQYFMVKPNPYSAPYVTTYLTNRASLNSNINAQNGIGTIVAPNLFTVINRNNSANFSSYTNGSLLATLSTASSGVPTGSLFFYNMAGSLNADIEMHFVGGSLTATEISDFYDLITDYRNDV